MAMKQIPDILACVQSHFDKLTTLGLDTYGRQSTAMWMASLDTRTGRYPDDDTRPDHIPKRVYRSIDAPRGCSLYWDQPSIVAAHALSLVSDNQTYSLAADAYVKDFLSRCVAHNGIFLWGNHYYYHAFNDHTVKFPGAAQPFACDMASETGDYHEIRPLSPAWQGFWRVNPLMTRRAIEVAAKGHLVDSDTGLFNRHADNRVGCAFIEHAGTTIESLAWLYHHDPKPDAHWLVMAAAIARYCFNHRDPNTGLMENNPTETRWDKFTSTTEAGLWAGCLLRAAALIPDEPCAAVWIDMADQVMTDWLKYGYDQTASQYYGRLNVADGKPILEKPKTLYEPGDHTDLWRPLFPVHDYPMSFAQAVLALHKLTGKDIYATSCHRWRETIAQSLPARNGQGGYAEHYGRCLHFLLASADHFPNEQASYLDLAHTLAAEAVDTLYENDMFRGHPGEHRYDAVDGVGFLTLALLWLATGNEPDNMGLGW